MTDLPEFVYLITVDGEWPVQAVADCHPSTADTVAEVVARRSESGNVWHSQQVHVWKVPVANAQEVDLMPATTVRASLRERPA